MFRLLAIIVLIGWTLTACRQPPAPSGEGNASKAKPSAMRAPPMSPSAMGPRPGPHTGEPARPSPAQAQRKRTCLSLYRARIKRLSTLLQKLSIHRTDDQLEKDYALDGDATLRPCTDLTATQHRCVIAQPNPLLAGQPCRLDESLALRAPPALMALVSPRPTALDDATRRRLIAGLRGQWVRRGPDGYRVELSVTPEGAATFRRSRNNRRGTQTETGQLSMRHRQVLLLRRSVTLQRFVYFRLDRNTFLLSGNPLHIATPIRNRNGFVLQIARDRVLRVAAGQCEVIDLSHLAAHPATCSWAPDQVTRVPVLRINYVLGRWKRQERFFFVRSHLLHERLYRRRFVRS